MHKSAIAQRFFLIVFMLLSACENARIANNPGIKVDEISNNTVSYDETIHINNCGGKADSEQTASRSFATNIEGGIEIGVQQIVEGSISAKYSQYRNMSKSMRLLAPPGTNMEFVLRWSEDVHAGNVAVNGSTGTYEVRVPIGVEQISSQDLGCSGIPSSNTNNANPVPTQQIIQPPTELPIATEAPGIEPVYLPDTSSGTILEVGQTWYQGGIEVAINSAHISGENLELHIIVVNRNPYEITTQIDNRTFRVVTNTGVETEIHRWDSGTYTLYPEDAREYYYSYFLRYGSLGDSSISEVFAIVNISRITDAKWHIPIYH